MCVIWWARYEGLLNGNSLCDNTPYTPYEICEPCELRGHRVACTIDREPARSFPIPCKGCVAREITTRKEQWLAILNSTTVSPVGNPVLKIDTLDAVDVRPRMISYPDVLANAFWDGPGGYWEIVDLLSSRIKVLPLWRSREARRLRHDPQYQVPIDLFIRCMERAGRLFIDNYTGVLPYGSFAQRHRQVRRHFWFDTHAQDDTETVELAAWQELEEEEAPQGQIYGTDSEVYDSPRPLLQWNSDSS